MPVDTVKLIGGPLKGTVHKLEEGWPEPDAMFLPVDGLPNERAKYVRQSPGVFLFDSMEARD